VLQNLRQIQRHCFSYHTSCFRVAKVLSKGCFCYREIQLVFSNVPDMSSLLKFEVCKAVEVDVCCLSAAESSTVEPTLHLQYLFVTAFYCGSPQQPSCVFVLQHSFSLPSLPLALQGRRSPTSRACCRRWQSLEGPQ
jgi:hypothetical protein